MHGLKEIPDYPGEKREWTRRLDRALKRTGLTNEQIAAKMGKTHSAISKWRSGERMPSPDELAYLCICAGISADEVLGIRPLSRERLIDELEEQTQRAFEELRRK
jgi:transcriptional regulator with XRE-family HTH domain